MSTVPASCETKIGSPIAGTELEARIRCQHAAFRSISEKMGLKTCATIELIFVQSVGGYMRAPTYTSHTCKFSQSAVGVREANGCVRFALRSAPPIFSNRRREIPKSGPNGLWIRFSLRESGRGA